MIGFYVCSFQNPIRKANIEQRFKAEGVEVEFVPCVNSDDSRLLSAPEPLKRSWSIMWNHLDMLKHFLQSDNTYGIFCEDDILLRKGLKSFLPELIASFERRKLDILLLSYLTTTVPTGLITHNGFCSSDINCIYLTFGGNLWGAHMYMLNRHTAQRFLDQYTVEYSIQTLTDSTIQPFSPDWTLTKNGVRALVYPMMGLEEGFVNTDNVAQIEFHKSCFKTHYNPDYYH